MSMPPDKQDYSLRNFPPDIFAALGLPIAITAIFFSWFLSVHGTAWICMAAVSFGIAVLGAVLLFIAKLPLYRQKRFLTFGIQALPESSHAFYRWGCRCANLGCVLMFFLWLGSTLWR
jgi:hypothetical protein